MKRLAIPVLIAAAALTLLSASPAAAGHRGRHAQRGYAVQRYDAWSYRQPVYHGPSVHLDSQYHAESYHWTPWSGIHSHGHYDVTPHFTPGHFDSGHGGHIDVDPWFHH